MAIKLPSSLSDPSPPRPLAPPSESGWYRVYTPVDTFTGKRLGKTFEAGEAVVGAHETRRTPLPGTPDQEERLVDIMVRDLGYSATPIPVGVAPVPRSALPPEDLAPPDFAAPTE